MTVTVGLWLAFGLVILGVLGILISGIRSIIQGKQDLRKSITMIIPFVVFAITYGIYSDIAKAGISTMVIMMGVMVLGTVLSRLRGALNVQQLREQRMVSDETEREEPQIGGAGMADIALLLLIFFLLVTTIDVDTGIGLQLPPAPEENVEPP